MVSTKKLLARLKIKHFDFDPNLDTPVDVGWEDMRDFDNVAMSFFRTIGTGDIDTFRVLANAASDGSGTDVVVKTVTITDQPNAVGDQIFTEVTADEVQQAASDAGVADVRYVSLQIEFATATDEGVATYVFGGPRFAHDGLTADIVA